MKQNVFPNIILLLIFLSLFSTLLFSFQRGNPSSYIFPIQGPIQIAGTFGELRPNHFHSGLDIKTGGQEGKPILAVADGYVYRVRVSPFGLGNAVFLKHADGNFSVYGHLSKFADSIEKEVSRRQYASKKYEQEIYFTSEEIRVKRGEVIALSGNSGNSMGPHLHFEIRDPQNLAMDPLAWYPNTVKDNTAPYIEKIAFHPLSIESRINGDFSKSIFNVTRNSAGFALSETVIIEGPVGLEYLGFDKADESHNRLGINYSSLFLDDNLIFSFGLERLDFDERKLINFHMDYGKFIESGQRFERAYLASGNSLKTYPTVVNKGWIELKDDKIHPFRLEIWDWKNNRTVISGNLKRKETSAEKISALGTAQTPRLHVEIQQKILKIVLFNPDIDSKLQLVFNNNKKEILSPFIRKENEWTYLFNLSTGEIPVEVIEAKSGKKQKLNVVGLVYPFKNTTFNLENLGLFFPYESAGDTLPLMVKTLPRFSHSFSASYQIGDSRVPMKHNFLISIRPENASPTLGLVVARQKGLGRWHYVGGTLSEEGTIVATTDEFGIFCLMEDKTPPTVSLVGFEEGEKIGMNTKGIRVEIRDEFSGIDPGRILLTCDGNWVPAQYDAKSATLQWNWQERPSPGKHFIETVVFDNAGNNRSKSFQIIL